MNDRSGAYLLTHNPHITDDPGCAVWFLEGPDAQYAEAIAQAVNGDPGVFTGHLTARRLRVEGVGPETELAVHMRRKRQVDDTAESAQRPVWTDRAYPYADALQRLFRAIRRCLDHLHNQTKTPAPAPEKSGRGAPGGSESRTAAAVDPGAMDRAAEKVARVSGAGDNGDAKPKSPPAGGDESAGPALTANQSRVLQTMARFDASRLLSSKMIAEEMDAAVRLSEETVRQCVGKLIESNLAERPEGDRSGARLTTAGRKLAGKIGD